jgi:predicted CopG family antitoxin
MGTKQVRLEESVYAKIADQKRDDETFSEAVDRLITDWSLAEFSIGLTDDDRRAFREAVADIETTTAKNVDEMLTEMTDDE